MKRKCSKLFIVLVVVILWGCGNKIPDDIIQPSAMEDLLYDYHVAKTMSADLPYSDNYKKNAYLSYVFEKHHVTEAEFDSSMVWYSRNGKELSTIYENLKKRFDTDAEQMKRSITRQNGEIAVSMPGDTVNIWQDRSLYWLTSSPYTNKVLFELKADTSFKPKDVLTLESDFSFLPRRGQVGKAVMGLKVTFGNDSVQGMTRVVGSSGRQYLSLRPDSAFEYKNVSGFIYYMGPENMEGNLLLNDISLVRIHQKNVLAEPVARDSSQSKLSRPLMRRE